MLTVQRKITGGVPEFLPSAYLRQEIDAFKKVRLLAVNPLSIFDV
jgi:hypothetical protein